MQVPVIMVSSSNFGYIPHSSRVAALEISTLAVDSLEISTLAADSLTVSGGAVMASLGSVVNLTQASVDAGLFESPLDSAKVYVVDGNINMTGHTVVVPAGGLQLRGLGFIVSSLFTTDNGTQLFTSPVGGSGDIFAQEMAFSTSGAGSSVFALTDSDGSHSAAFFRLNFDGCSSLGYFDGYRQGLEENTGRFGSTPGLEFRGTWLGGYTIQTSIVRGVSDTVFSLFKCAVGQTFASRFGTNTNAVLPANVTAFEMAEANFTGDGLLQVSLATFAGPGAVFAGLSASNKKVRVTSSVGTENTYVGAFWKVATSVATTFTLVNTSVLMAGITAATDLVWFSQPGNNNTTYLSTLTARMVGTFNGSFIGGNNKQFTLAFRRWDSSAGVYSVLATTQFTTGGTGKFESVMFFSPRIDVDVNDRVEIWIANNTDTSSITASTETQFNLHEAR
jgi:hypothetical protein